MAKLCTNSKRHQLLQCDRDDNDSLYTSLSSSSYYHLYPPLFAALPSSSLEYWSSSADNVKAEFMASYYHDDPMLGYPHVVDHHHPHESDTALQSPTSEPAAADFSIQAVATTMWPSPKTDADEYASASPRTPPRDQSTDSLYQNQILLPPSSGIIPASDNIILDMDSNGPSPSIINTTTTTTTLTDLYYHYNKTPASAANHSMLTSDYHRAGSDLSVLFATENAARANAGPPLSLDPVPLANVFSDIEWCFSGDDEDEDTPTSTLYDQEDAATTAPMASWSFEGEVEDEPLDSESMIDQEEEEDDDDDDDDEPLVVETHPLNLLLADLRDQLAMFPTEIKENQWHAINQKVSAVLDKETDGGEPAIRKCVQDCVEILAKRIVRPQHAGWSDDDDEHVPVKKRQQQRRRSASSSSRLPVAAPVPPADEPEDMEEDEEDDDGLVNEKSSANINYSSDEEYRESAQDEDGFDDEEEDDDNLSVYTGSEYDDDFRVVHPRRDSTLSSGSSHRNSSSKGGSSVSSVSSSSSSSKKTRKNYSRETTRVLMNWYLQRGGKSPEPVHKEALAKEANKSLVQVSTWFQNARRRHHHKLIHYQRLSKEFPSKVYDYDSFMAFSEEAALSRKDASKKRTLESADEDDDAAHTEAGPPSPKRK